MVTKGIALSPQARTAIVVAVGWVTGAVLVLSVAFAWGPFASNPPVIWAGVGLAALVHATAAALFVRWGFELGLWAVVTGRRRALTVVMLVVASLATVAVVRFDRLILAELTGGYAAGYRAAIGVGIVAGAAFEAAFLARWVRRVDAGGAAEPGRWDALVPLTGGVGLGVVAMALFFAGGAVVRNARLDDFVAEIPVIRGIEGTYFAFGDSYSAGEGLPPFDRWTAKVDADGANRCHRSSRGYPACFGSTSRRRRRCSRPARAR